MILYNINRYIEVDSCSTSTSKADYPFSQWNGEWDDENRLKLCTDDALYYQVKNTIKSIAKEDSKAYEQLFVAYKFYYWEVCEYNLYSTPPKDKSSKHKNAISMLAEIHRKGREAYTSLNNNDAMVKVETSNEIITRISVSTPTKTYLVPDHYYRLAEFDIERLGLEWLFKSRKVESDKEDIKQWLKGVLDPSLTEVIKGNNIRNNYEKRLFRRLGGLYRWLNDNNLISSTPKLNVRDATIEFIKQLFNLQYADYGKMIEYLTLEKGIIPKR